MSFSAKDMYRHEPFDKKSTGFLFWTGVYFEVSNCITDIRTIHKFLNLTEGNWRNSIYIECEQCKYEPHESCRDYLCTFDEHGTPVMLPICDCEVLFARYIDPSECLLWVSQLRFKEIYSAWVKMRQSASDQCPFRTVNNWTWKVITARDIWRKVTRPFRSSALVC